MNVADILKQLETDDGNFPAEAVRAAIKQREAITPALLACLQETADDPQEVADRDDAVLHMHALYLLAQLRERAAYPLMLKLFSAPGDLCFDVAGDVVTEDLHRILAAVCGDDVGPIKSMIEDRNVNEYVRSACMRTLVLLVARGELERSTVVDYFRSLFHGKLERAADFLWGSLVSASCDLYPEELLPEIEHAFADDLVDPFFIGIDAVERAMAEGRNHALSGSLARGTIKAKLAEMARPYRLNDTSPRRQSAHKSLR